MIQNLTNIGESFKLKILVFANQGDFLRIGENLELIQGIHFLIKYFINHKI